MLQVVSKNLKKEFGDDVGDSLTLQEEKFMLERKKRWRHLASKEASKKRKRTIVLVIVVFKTTMSETTMLWTTMSTGPND